MVPHIVGKAVVDGGTVTPAANPYHNVVIPWNADIMCRCGVGLAAGAPVEKTRVVGEADARTPELNRGVVARHKPRAEVEGRRIGRRGIVRARPDGSVVARENGIRPGGLGDGMGGADGIVEVAVERPAVRKAGRERRRGHRRDADCRRERGTSNVAREDTRGFQRLERHFHISLLLKLPLRGKNFPNS